MDLEMGDRVYAAERIMKKRVRRVRFYNIYLYVVYATICFLTHVAIFCNKSCLRNKKQRYNFVVCF